MTSIVAWKVDFAADVQLTPLNFYPEPDTLDSSSAHLPAGAYTTFRTFFENKALHLQQHLSRLKETASLTNIPIELEENQTRTAIRRTIQGIPGDKRIRLTLDLVDHPGTLYIQTEPLRIPSPDGYRRGVRTVTRVLQRENPKAKLTRFISMAGDVRQELPIGIHEALMLDPQGHILEGLSSNFFAVIGNEIWTEEEKVLSGITRSIVLEEAKVEGIPVYLNSISLKDLPKVKEAFITSSSRAVLPVTQIDYQMVGNGAPGPITLQLLKRYQERIQREVEPI
jgi:branched-chain amino acid aminotransferase